MNSLHVLTYLANKAYYLILILSFSHAKAANWRFEDQKYFYRNIYF